MFKLTSIFGNWLVKIWESFEEKNVVSFNNKLKKQKSKARYLHLKNLYPSIAALTADRVVLIQKPDTVVEVLPANGTKHC